MADSYQKLTSDSELLDAVRAETQYSDSESELPASELEEIMQNAKRRVFLETGSKAWYSDEGIGLVLLAYTAMRAKSAVENAPIAGYTLGDEQVQIRQADPDTSAQIQQWAEDVRVGLDASDLDSSNRNQIRNTSSYIGTDYVK